MGGLRALAQSELRRFLIFSRRVLLASLLIALIFVVVKATSQPGITVMANNIPACKAETLDAESISRLNRFIELYEKKLAGEFTHEYYNEGQDLLNSGCGLLSANFPGEVLSLDGGDYLVVFGDGQLGEKFVLKMDDVEIVEGK